MGKNRQFKIRYMNNQETHMIDIILIIRKMQNRLQ